MVVPEEVGKIDNPHLLTARRKFAVVPDDRRTAQNGFIFLCFTNRCGSNYIAGSIASDGRLNVAGEYFNSATMEEEPFGSASLFDYLAGLVRQEGKNDLLVAKISVAQVKMLNDFGVLSALLPRSKFVLIRRSDLLGQAISMHIAWQNQQWVSSAAATIADAELKFSREQLQAILADIVNQNALFDRFFALNGIIPYPLNYEAFVQSPDDHLLGLSAWLGLTPRLRHNPAAVSLERQSRDVHRAWRERFLRDVSGAS